MVNRNLCKCLILSTAFFGGVLCDVERDLKERDEEIGKNVDELKKKLIAQSTRMIIEFRKWLPVLVCMFFLTTGYHQVKAQTAALYNFNSFVSPYTHDSGTSLSYVLTDNNNGALGIPIGFAFNFAGTNYDSVYASSNGFLAFLNTISNADSNNTFSNAKTNGPVLMPLWDDLSGAAPACRAMYTTLGTAPNRIFKVEYARWAWDHINSNSSSTGVLSFQIMLYETTNTIEFHYRPDSIPYNGLSGGATIGIFNDSTDWQVLTSVLPYALPSSAFFTTNIADMPDSGRVYQWFPAPTAVGVLDSFSVLANHNCSGVQLTVSTHSYMPGMYVKTNFGDNQSDSSIIINGNLGGLAVISHTYALSGNYTVKQKLYVNNAVADSLQFSFQHVVCYAKCISFYYDSIQNCARDTNESYTFIPVLTEVDSNGISIDTVSCTSGFYYNFYGNVGDVLEFKPISLEPGYVIACPVSGIIRDTIHPLMNNLPAGDFGIRCSQANNFDLKEIVAIHSGTNRGLVEVDVSNTYCIPVNAVLSINYSPKYTNYISYPPPTAINGHVATWNLSALAFGTQHDYIRFYTQHAGPQNLPIGDTVNTIVTLTPMAGDVDTTNNLVIKCDTITGPFDPNHMTVEPDGYITAGTELRYTIQFENVGNAEAINVHVMDTLPNEVDINSLRVVAASATMFISIYRYANHNVVKFDFPNIHLPDSVHFPENCNGMLVFTINSKTGLPPGTLIPNRAGIYFDYNEVVITNTATDTIAYPDNTLVPSTSNGTRMSLYPNPATDELIIGNDDASYTSFSITNNLGQTILKGEMKGRETKINVSQISAGMYYLQLNGRAGRTLRKFVKM